MHSVNHNLFGRRAGPKAYARLSSDLFCAEKEYRYSNSTLEDLEAEMTAFGKELGVKVFVLLSDMEYDMLNALCTVCAPSPTTKANLSISCITLSR